MDLVLVLHVRSVEVYTHLGSVETVPPKIRPNEPLIRAAVRSVPDVVVELDVHRWPQLVVQLVRVRQTIRRVYDHLVYAGRDVDLGDVVALQFIVSDPAR